LSDIKIPPGKQLELPVILNDGTVNEFGPYIEKGWMKLASNGNMMTLGAGNRIGNSLEDQKRPYGMGSGFVLSIDESYFKEES
jgi:hypothetical protein